ncbi:MAG TPA: ABC transporter substrate-binding protein [Thermoplasmata archaeon]|nr:ABC transporter substrate-binding protein [Thermoplasmata archaeon]
MAEGGGVAPPEARRSGAAKGIGVAIVIVVAVLTFLAGVGVGWFVFKPAPAKLTFVVGTNIPFPPFESYNDTKGQFEGFDIDLAQLFANALGRTMVVRNFNDFDLLLATVGRGGVDMAASGITMSGQRGALRNSTMSFSNPYYNANQGVLVRASDTTTCPNNRCTSAQLGNKTIGVQSGTTSEAWVDQYIKPFDRNNATDIHRYASVTTELQDLRSAVYQFMIIDAAPALAIAGGSGGALKYLGTIITNELYGFAVAHNDPQGIIPTINSVLGQIKANGQYDALLLKWFK